MKELNFLSDEKIARSMSLVADKVFWDSMSTLVLGLSFLLLSARVAASRDKIEKHDKNLVGVTTLASVISMIIGVALACVSISGIASPMGNAILIISGRR